MKVINWKAYKEINLQELSKEELIKVIEDLQNELEEGNKFIGTNTAPLRNSTFCTKNPIC